MGYDLLEQLQGLALHASRVERILTPVTGDAELGQAEDRGSLVTSLLDGRQDRRLVRVPRQGCLVDGPGGDLDQFHEVDLPTAIFSCCRRSFKHAISAVAKVGWKTICAYGLSPRNTTATFS